jgi:hypothetical protein
MVICFDFPGVDWEDTLQEKSAESARKICGNLREKFYGKSGRTYSYVPQTQK